MGELALGLIVLWLGLVSGVRGYPLVRRTGSVGVRFGDRRGSSQWWSRLIGTVAMLLAVAAALAETAGVPSFAILDREPVRARRSRR